MKVPLNFNPSVLEGLYNRFDSGEIVIPESCRDMIAAGLKSCSGDSMKVMACIMQSLGAAVLLSHESAFTGRDVYDMISLLFDSLVLEKRELERDDFEQWMKTPAYGEDKKDE